MLHLILITYLDINTFFSSLTLVDMPQLEIDATCHRYKMISLTASDLFALVRVLRHFQVRARNEKGIQSRNLPISTLI